MGVGCTRPIERVLAAVGFSLFLHLSKTFPTLCGYYTTLQVVILLAYMALCRIKTVEQLQYESPGELGKLLGLVRVPEVRCLRNKLTYCPRHGLRDHYCFCCRPNAVADHRVGRT